MATIIQTPIHAARHFVAIVLEYNTEVIPSDGYEIHYDKMIAWCSKNILNRWYSGKMQQTLHTLHARAGTEDVSCMAIFNFEDPKDKAHFILKWL